MSVCQKVAEADVSDVLVLNHQLSVGCDNLAIARSETASEFNGVNVMDWTILIHQLTF